MFLRHLLLGCMLGSVTQITSAAPPNNTWLADSLYPQIHQGPWQQDSTPSPGPVTAAQLGSPQYVPTGLVNIALLQSPAVYPGGARVYWGGAIDKIYKVAIVNGNLKVTNIVDRYGSTLSNVMTPFAGAYTAVRFDNTYLTGARRTVLAYRDNVRDINSAITLYKSYEIPTSVAPDPGALTPNHITALNVLFDGKIAVATRYGTVGVVDIESGRGKFTKVADGETISNNIAVGSDGAIYVVSSKQMYRFQWNTGTTWDESTLQSPLDAAGCDLCWNQVYDADAPAPGTLGAGSGSTPSLMGPNGEYVVITDGAKVAKLSVYRTGKLLSGEQRLAAAMPVNFGDPNRAQTASEQSVVVSDYGMAVVSNDYRNVNNLGDDIPYLLKLVLNPLLSLPALQNISTAKVTLTGYGPRHQPWGVQKFSFDPNSSTLKSDWIRTDVSCPNAIPLMSATSRRFYCVGAKDLTWTIESIDWDTGLGHFRKDVGLLPRYNSFYAPTELTPDGGVIYGSFDGVVYLPKR